MRPSQAAPRSASARKQVLLAGTRLAMAVGLLCVLPLAYQMIARTGGHMSGQMAVTRIAGLGGLSVVALVLLTTMAVSVLQIRGSRHSPAGGAWHAVRSRAWQRRWRTEDGSGFAVMTTRPS